MTTKEDEKKVTEVTVKAPRKMSPEFIAAKRRDLDIEVARRRAGLNTNGGGI